MAAFSKVDFILQSNFKYPIKKQNEKNGTF